MWCELGQVMPTELEVSKSRKSTANLTRQTSSIFYEFRIPAQLRENNTMRNNCQGTWGLFERLTESLPLEQELLHTDLLIVGAFVL